MTETAIAPDRPADGVTTPGRGRTRSLPWEYLGLTALLGGTAIAYLWNLSANGWANSFYAAAVQSGAKSWKAFFFGSSDWGNSITVDKTPASLWPMEISARLFGMNSWSMLIPQVLIAVAAVALLWSTLRRTFGPGAGLLGGLALAVTPVATLMFRYNNPDALLVLLMIAAVWAMTRALEDGRWRWLLLCGGFVGLGFLAKQLQVLLVVPALALTYLFAGPPRLGKRLLQLLAAGAALVVGAGWWVLVAQLWPADSRPYFGGSKHNSIIELTLGYNGLQRLGVDSGGGFGGPPGPGGRGHGPSFGSEAGITRLFSETVGGQIAWLIPAALILCVTAVVLCGKASRTDTRRAALLLWGGWALVTALVFSFMKGIFHQYYTVALAPGVAGAAAIGAVVLWRQRDRLGVRLVLAAAAALTTVTAVILLDRTPDFVPWLRWIIGVAGAVATVALVIPQPRRTAAWTAVLAVAVAIAGPVAYSIQTIATAHNGGIVLAGPKTSGGFGFGFGPGGPGGACGPAGPGMPGGTGSGPSTPAPGTNGTRPGAPGQEVAGAPSAGSENGCAAAGPGAGPADNGSDSAGAAQAPGQPGRAPRSGEPAATAPGAGQRAVTDRPAGPGMGERTNQQLIDLLKNNGAGYTWAAAAISSMGAADLQLDSGYAVMPIGGFGGGDPSPTLDQFRADVAQGRIHYFVGSERRGPGSAETSAASRIAQWVESTYAATDVGGTKVYDLTAPTAAR
ncbi:glycosyltransferase family 39 protein [Nocardia sp. BSTN01]|uniref:glycosyltransferase family 39 protein n=1 Tax=Nocardia sp. BSTN01 TaxID=2783665 RepID=UPI0018902C65|nr:glycosyltransferase family 39 protein [Nocardia sp. BSTN01]MBF4996402.1 glycosyltransferase family 39 protein [Nocardia sp. BSTN01]